MKTVPFKVILLVLVLAGMSSRAAGEKTRRQERETGPFSSISVSSGIDLFLTQGSVCNVTVEAEPELVDKIRTEVRDGQLKIYIRDRQNWNIRWNQVRRVHVVFTELTALHASAGADVQARNPLRLGELDVSSSSGADVNLTQLTATRVSVETSSGADACIGGKARELHAHASSGSDLDCRELVARDGEVSVSSGADASVHVTGMLRARASSGGDIRYAGNPEQREFDESSGGDINRL